MNPRTLYATEVQNAQLTREYWVSHGGPQLDQKDDSSLPGAGSSLPCTARENVARWLQASRYRFSRRSCVLDSYDGLNRRKFAGFGTQAGPTYQSTISYTYDAGNRLTKAVDSVGGTIQEGYDNLDRLTSETTPQGSISYGYDNAERTTSMQVAGQSAVSYSWDNGNRLTQISQGSSNVGLSYDNANRRSSLTLPNGVVVSYTYDNDSRLTGITYQFGINTLGNLFYGYDQIGRRTQMGGSFARTGLPAAITSATYDAGNELTNWNGTTRSPMPARN